MSRGLCEVRRRILRRRCSPSRNAAELDGLAEFYSLDSAGVEALLELAERGPSRSEGTQLPGQLPAYRRRVVAGRGLVFFVAANWSKIAVFGRFALLEVVLVACAVVALHQAAARARRPRARCSSAFITTGALLALFGQTYQTGADVYELFLTWALLGLPIGRGRAVERGVGRLGAGAQHRADAVLRLASHGWPALGAVRRRALSARAHHPLARPGSTSLLWFAFEFLTRRRGAGLGAPADRISCAFGFGTWGACSASGRQPPVRHQRDDPVSMLALVGGHDRGALPTRCAAQRHLSTRGGHGNVHHRQHGVACTTSSSFDDEGMFLLLALWLIGTSTAAGRFSPRSRARWRAEGAA